MNDKNPGWAPLRPTPKQCAAMIRKVADIKVLQQVLEEHKYLCCPDRVAHQYQMAGSKRPSSTWRAKSHVRIVCESVTP